MSSPMPLTTTQYPGGEPAVYVAPDFQQIGADALIGNSTSVANLQQQITTLQSQMSALDARVTALESASGGAA